MKPAKAISAMAEVRARVRPPVVIKDAQSRRAAVRGWRAKSGTPPGSRCGRLLGYQHEECILEACSGFTGLPAQIVKCTFCYEPPARNDADAIGHALRHLENMRGHDDGPAGTHALAKHILHLTGRAGVEACQWLVEDDQRGPLPHALGEPLAALVRMRLEAQPADARGLRP